MHRILGSRIFNSSKMNAARMAVKRLFSSNHGGGCKDKDLNGISAASIPDAYRPRNIHTTKAENPNNTYDSDWDKLEGHFATDETFQKEFESCFLEKILALLLNYIKENRDSKGKVLNFYHPHQMKEVIGNSMEIPSSAKNLKQILKDCEETFKYCVKSGHPRFFNQLSCGLDTISLAGEFIIAATNSNMFTYEVAPLFTLIEEITLKKMRQVVGWSSGDGIFTPGGAIANLYAVLAARHRYYGKVKNDGLFGAPRMVMFTSEQAHFSIQRAAIISGIGSSQVKLVPCDSRGKMIIKNLLEEIKKTIRDGDYPFMVCATGGTTVLGAFDPIIDIEQICRKYGLWLHVDCAWGGGALVSENHRHLLKGIELADSVTWNPHKAMGVTLQCSTILLKDQGILEQCNALYADYLFQKDKPYDETYDTGDKAIQCGRRNDAFKLWLMWRAKGDQGFQDQIDKLFDLARYLRSLLKENDGFELVLEQPEYLNLCFWYIPKKYRRMLGEHEKNVMLSNVTAEIKSQMMVCGTTMIGYQPLMEKPNFFRMIISNPSTRRSDLDFIVAEIIRFGEGVTLK